MNNYYEIKDLFEAFTRMKVVVVGDVMVDSYLWGIVERISPEAPVPIVQVQRHESRPGGAANVAINLQALGATPILISVIGSDRYGDEFMSLLSNNDLKSNGILRSSNRITTVKTRVIGNHHQLIRVDEESTTDLDGDDAAKLVAQFKSICKDESPDVIIMEDYDKGILSEQVIHEIISHANKLNIPVTVDPKKKNFLTYKNVQLFKPNFIELKMGLKLELEKGDITGIHNAALELISRNEHALVMITLSEAGVFICDKETYSLIPAHIRDISDVSGAGDTVISVASLGLAAGLPKEAIAGLSNLAGGLVCETVGVAPVNRQQLMREAQSLKLPLNETKNS